jgi:hypothetical protein
MNEIGFQRRRSDDLPREAYGWLKKASERSKLFKVDLDACIKSCESENVHIYTVESDTLIGCFIVTFKKMGDNYIMSLLLLGGIGLLKWRDDLVKFLESLSQKRGVTYFSMMGPFSRKRFFPEVTLVTCVYGKIPEYLTRN